MNNPLLSDLPSSSGFRDQINGLLGCPITGRRLNNPHVIKITRQDGEEIILTVSGSALTPLPNAFEANKPNARLVGYQGVAYEVQPCFDRVINDLLTSLESNQNDEEFKVCVESALQCSISRDFFVQPVITSTGYTYSQTDWDKWRRLHPSLDMNRGTVAFVYRHDLLERLIAVYKHHFPSQQNEEAVVQTNHAREVVPARRFDRLRSLLFHAGGITLGEVGFVAFLAWFCGGCNSHSLALKLAIGGGVGCCVGLYGSGILYFCCTTPEERQEDCVSLYSGCGVCFYPCLPRENSSERFVSLAMHPE